MFTAEKNQVEICLLKSNLEEIENELVVQRSAWPKFDAENEQKFRESLSAVRVSRALCVEIENLNQENVRLVAKRMYLKMQSEDLAKSLEKAREEYNDMSVAYNQENRETELLIREYEGLLREKTTRFRQTRACFNEKEMTRETETIDDANLELETEIANRRSVVEEMKRQLDELAPNVPEDLLIIVGKKQLDDEVKFLSEKNDALQKAGNDLLKKLNNTFSSFLRK
ncbi:uncharacterized protein LOC126371614 [Pectinophora gossypiella]|uniref:uncharacterized protein LOC126371614 n=1 Tax=Pectinophora gossypiella TaxID=13191 RepID=UPI00214EBD56|nr:uncharacterized protein LOC126371614 [Pectinophora gossypiella]